MKNLKYIAPDYPRIPHLSSEISRLGFDDYVEEAVFPLKGFVQEKVDAANMGISWGETAILRNRNHILNKGYSKIRTPAKEQFKSAWNWVHSHEKDIKKVESEWGCKVTIYGEWMWAQHSLSYDKVPDWFMAYDIWSVEDKKFIAPLTVQKLLKNTSIYYIPTKEMNFKDLTSVKDEAEQMSSYREGQREGIVIKTVKGDFVDNFYKVVNDFFDRRDDFNDVPLIKNVLAK